MLAGLAAYVRALDSAACGAGRQTLTVASLMGDARRALIAAQDSDPQTAVLLTAGARARLGLIDERFAGPDLAAERQALRAADRSLLAVQAALRRGDPRVARTIAAWLKDSRRLETRLAAAQPRSLFDPHRLSQTAKLRLPL